jgi:hypothetical protein
MRKYWIFLGGGGGGGVDIGKNPSGVFLFCSIMVMNNLQSSYNTSKTKRITQIQDHSFQSLVLHAWHAKFGVRSQSLVLQNFFFTFNKQHSFAFSIFI